MKPIESPINPYLTSDVQFSKSSPAPSQSATTTTALSPQLKVQLFHYDAEVKKIELRAKKIEQVKKEENAEALYQLALSFQTGIDVEEDLPQAALLYEQAVNQNHLPSINALGFCYQHGLGVNPDPSKAFNLYLQAALKGFEPSLSNLSFCYALGKGSADDREIYEEWQAKMAKNDTQQPTLKITITPPQQNDRSKNDEQKS